MIARLLKGQFGRNRKGVSLGLELAPGRIAWAQALSRNQPLQTGIVEVETGNRAGALRKLVNDRSLKGANVNLVLSQDHYRVFQTERPPVEDREMAEALRWKIAELMEYPASAAVIDSFPFPEDASRDRGQLINAVCAHERTVGECVETVHEAGLELNRIDIAELALRNLIARAYPQEDSAVGLVCLSEHQGLIVFCRDDTLYMARRIDVSLRQLRDAASQEKSVEALTLEMQRSLDYFESQLRQVPPGTIQVAGHPAALPLTGMLTNSLTADVVNFDGSRVMGDATGGFEPGAALALGALLGESGVGL